MTLAHKRADVEQTEATVVLSCLIVALALADLARLANALLSATLPEFLSGRQVVDHKDLIAVEELP